MVLSYESEQPVHVRSSVKFRVLNTKFFPLIQGSSEVKF